MPKNIVHGAESRAAILRGVNTLADAVRVTLGPRGRNVVIEKRFGPPSITKDGVSVAREIELPDALENMGAQMLREVALKTSDLAGDGTTTATVLAQVIYSRGLAQMDVGRNPMALKRGIDKAVEAVVGTRRRIDLHSSAFEYVGGALNEISTPVGPDDLAKIGTISANGDEHIGAMIADAINRVGEDGVITVEESGTMDTELHVVEGMQFDRGYISPYFVTNPERMEAVLDNPYILITTKSLSTVDDVKRLMERVAPKGPLFIIAPEIGGLAAQTLVMNQLQRSIRCCAVKAPGFGAQQADTLRDLAVLTGGVAITDELAIPLHQVDLRQLGRATKIVVTRENTTILEGGIVAGSPDEDRQKIAASVAERVAEIRGNILTTKVEFEVRKLRERLAKLTGGVAVIKVGAPTELEMKEKKDRVEDAMHATRAAVEEGIVPGGGIALLRCTWAVENIKSTLKDTDEVAGAQLVLDALTCPAVQIAENAGVAGRDVLPALTGKLSVWGWIVDFFGWVVRELSGHPHTPRVFARGSRDSFGFNAATGEFGDMIECGIIDPTKVTRTALIHAASIAGMMLTTEALISEIPLPASGNAMPPGMGMG